MKEYIATLEIIDESSYTEEVIVIATRITHALELIDMWMESDHPNLEYTITDCRFIRNIKNLIVEKAT